LDIVAVAASNAADADAMATVLDSVRIAFDMWHTFP